MSGRREADPPWLWPAEASSAALRTLAEARGWRGLDGVEGPPAAADNPAAQAARHGIAAEEVHYPEGELERVLRACAPALIRVSASGNRGWLAVLARRGRRLVLVDPAGGRHRPTLRAVAALARDGGGPDDPAIDAWLVRSGLSERRAATVRGRLRRHRSDGRVRDGCYLLRRPDASLWRHLRDAGLDRWLAGFLLGYTAGYATLLASWWTLGAATLGGGLTLGWLHAWGIVLLAVVIPRILSVWAQSRLAVGLGTVLRERMIRGTLALDIDRARRTGAGRLLGRMLETEAVEANLLRGGFLAIAGQIELVFAIGILSRGAGGPVHGAAALLAWLAALALGAAYHRRRSAWTDRRLASTHETVDLLVGHRTRVAQAPRARWHEREDRLLAAYHDASRPMDRLAVALNAGVPRGWLLVGTMLLLPALVAGRGGTVLAIGVGGVLTAHRGFGKLAEGLTFLVAARIAWNQIAELVRAGGDRGDGDAPPTARAREARSSSAPLLEARRITFRHQGRLEPAFARLDLRLGRGERALLLGPSGTGKSTLGAVLTGLRRPQEGLLLLDGLDAHAHGLETWRRRVVLAPQFHENHVFTGTLAFNLLLGRGWPAGGADRVRAEDLCRRLGLGDLLERMPCGLDQIVGESGWQLSHGERSRIFLARALLQEPDLLILDETFAALDPPAVSLALDCVLERPGALLVVAHLADTEDDISARRPASHAESRALAAASPGTSANVPGLRLLDNPTLRKEVIP